MYGSIGVNTREYICSVVDCLDNIKNLDLEEYADSLLDAFDLWAEFLMPEAHTELKIIASKALESVNDGDDLACSECYKAIQSTMAGHLLQL